MTTCLATPNMMHRTRMQVLLRISVSVLGKMPCADEVPKDDLCVTTMIVIHRSWPAY